MAARASVMTLVQIGINTAGAGYIASMYAGSGTLTHAAAGAVGSFATELIGSFLYFGANDWKKMASASAMAPIVTALSIAVNDQLGLVSTYVAIALGQILFGAATYFSA